jgi:hypothetical protein
MAPPVRPWVWFLQMAGLGVGMSIGISAAHELSDWWLARALIAGGIAGGVTLAWVGLVWLFFVRGRPPGE